MTTRLLTGEGMIWPRITKAAQNAARADVAVAYFGKGGATRLPLRAGSRIIVDASDAAVKAGVTCPAELLKYPKGVQIYSRPGLHAKVFVFGKRAFIGSANNSASSSNLLAEAVVVTSDRDLVADARIFVRESATGVRLGPEELRRLDKLYKEPRFTPGTGSQRKRNRAVWISELDLGDVPRGYETVEDQEQEAAESIRRHDETTHRIDVSWNSVRPKWHKGDVIVQVFDVAGRSMVEAPGTVLQIRKWSNGRRTYWFTHTEHRETRRCAYDRMLKSLGRGWRKRLPFDRKLKADVANTLLAWWESRA